MGSTCHTPAATMASSRWNVGQACQIQGPHPDVADRGRNDRTWSGGPQRIIAPLGQLQLAQELPWQPPSGKVQALLIHRPASRGCHQQPDTHGGYQHPSSSQACIDPLERCSGLRARSRSNNSRSSRIMTSAVLPADQGLRWRALCVRAIQPFASP